MGAVTPVPVIGHGHPAPPWPMLPGQPLGVPGQVDMTEMAGLLGAVIAQCRECTAWRTRTLLAGNPAPIAALAAQVYASMPEPNPDAPRAVRAVAQAARSCAGGQDYRAVMHAVVMLSAPQRGIVAMDLADLTAAIAGRQVPPPPI